MKRHSALIGLPFVLALAAGCGLKGPLYLPDEARDVVTRPAPPSSPSAPNSPDTVDSPDTPPSPTPEVTAPPETTQEESKEDGKNGNPPR